MIVNNRGETYEQEQARGRAERLETARKLRARGAPFTANEQAVIHCNLDEPRHVSVADDSGIGCATCGVRFGP